MGLEVNGLTPEQNRELLQLKQAGVTQEEIDQKIQQYYEKNAVEEENPHEIKHKFDDYWDKKVAEAKEKKANLDKSYRQNIKDGNYFAAFKDKIQYWQTSDSPVQKAGVNPIVALALGAAVVVLLDSCSKDELLEQTIVDIDTNVNITVKSSAADIIAAMNNNFDKCLDELRDNKNVLSAKLEEIVKLLVTQGGKFDKLTALVEALGMSVDTVVQLMLDNGVQLDKLVGLIDENNKQNDLIYNAILGLGKDNEELKGLLNQVIEIAKDQRQLAGDGNALLTQILNEIRELGKQGKANHQNTIKFLDEILKQLKTMDNNAKSASLKLMNAINDATKAINTNTAVSKENTQKVLDAISQVGTKVIQKLGGKADVIIDILGNILEKVDDFDMSEVVVLLNDISDKIGKMDKAHQAKFDELLKAINQNTEGDKANTQEIIDAINGVAYISNLILDKMDDLGDKADTMIDLLTKIAKNPGGSGEINLDDLKDFLKGLIATVNVNNNINTQAIIDAINAKQTGCTCDHSELVAKLEIIIHDLQSGKKGNEGIIEDLDNLFG